MMTTPHNRLAAHITAFSSFASKGRISYARKALQRVKDAAASGLLAAHKAATRGLKDRHLCEERTALKWAIELPKLPTEILDRIEDRSATLADSAVVLQLAIETGLASSSKARSIREAERLALLVHKNKNALSAFQSSRRALERMLNNYTHADLKMSPKSFGAFRSRLLALAAILDPARRQSLRANDLPQDWRALMASAKAAGLGGTLAKAYPIITAAVSADMKPAGVSSGIGVAVLEHFEQGGSADAFDRARAAVYGWNRLARDLTEFALPKLEVPSKRVNAGLMRRCRFDDLPPDLKEIWSTVVAEHASLDEGAGSLSDLVEEPASTDPYAAIIGKGAYSARSRYSQQTLTGMCSYFTRLANKALASGGHPRTLFECLEPALISSVLSDIEDGQKARAEARGVEHSSSNATLKGAATAMIALCSIAGRPEEEIERLKALRDRVDPSIIGIRKNSRTGGVTRIYSDERMGPKHKLMLQQFAGDAGAVKLRAYFTLPQLLLKPLKSKIQRRRPLHPVEIADYISALAILILQVCPVRRANLEGSLRIAGKNPTVSIPDNPREPVRLRVPASETKTRKRDVLAELPLEVSAVLREYVKHVRPQLMRNVGSGWDSGRLEFRADW